MDGIESKEIHLASKSASSGSTQFLQVSIKKVIDLETFGPPNGSEAFEAISGPAGQGLHPDGAELFVA